MYMYIYIHVYIHICIYIYIYIYMYVYIHIYLSIHIRVYIYIYICTHLLRPGSVHALFCIASVIRHGRCCGNTKTIKQRKTETINT